MKLQYISFYTSKLQSKWLKCVDTYLVLPEVSSGRSWKLAEAGKESGPGVCWRRLGWVGTGMGPHSSLFTSPLPHPLSISSSLGGPSSPLSACKIISTYVWWVGWGVGRQDRIQRGKKEGVQHESHLFWKFFSILLFHRGADPNLTPQLLMLPGESGVRIRKGGWA